MGKHPSVDDFVAQVIQGQSEFLFRSVERLSADQKYKCILELLNACERDKELMTRVIRCVGYMIPHIGSGRRFACLVRILEILHSSEQLYGKEVYNLLDFSIVNSLQPLELISLANILNDYIRESENLLKEISIWGLVRLIPHMHSVNQKEYANEIFKMHTDLNMRGQVLDSLITLIYSMDQGDRADLMMFFADNLKSLEPVSEKFFTLELLQKVTPALPEKERLHIADQAAPLIYFTDTELVKRSVDFFSVIISLLPQQDRFHYTQLVAGLINDASVKSHVRHAIEKSVPFLVSEEEKNQFRILLKQFETEPNFVEDRGDTNLERAYLYEN